MRTATRILSFFFAGFTIVVSFQLVFFLYQHISSWPWLVSRGSTLRSEQDLENATQLIISTSAYTSFNTESNWDSYKPREDESLLSEHSTTLITNRTCSQYYYLIILVSSAPGNWQRRNLIRKTWAFENAFNSRWATAFLVAQTRIQAESSSLLKEDNIHGDLVQANYYDHYWNQTWKIQMGFEWASKYCKFSFLLKTDDDVFVNVPGVLSFLSNPTTPNEKLYAGNHYKNPPVHRGDKWAVTTQEYSATHYPGFCPGFGYILSHDVIVSFVKAFSFVPYFRLDDVYVGMLANFTGIKIIHNEGFELDAPLQCVPNEGTLVRHDIEGDCLEEMFKRSSQLLRAFS